MKDSKGGEPTAEQLKAIKKAGGETKDRVHTLMNAEEKLATLKERQEQLNQGRIPPGMKPYSAPWTIPSLDEKYSRAGTALSISIPEDSTLGEAREILYTKFHSLMASIDIEIWSNRQAALVTETSFEHFVEHARSLMHMSALGLEKWTASIKAPPGLLLQRTEDEGYLAAVREYQNLVSAAARSRAARDLEKSKAAEKKEKEVKKALEMTAEQVLEAKFREIANRVQGTTSPKKTQPQPKSKNGSTPGEAQGHNQQKAGKGKGKGKVQNQSKGKGKGKGEVKGKSKGKSSRPELGVYVQPFWRKGGKGKGKVDQQKRK